MPTGEAQILGLASAGSSTDDSITLNSSYWTASALQNNPGDAEAALEHELTEGVMGRIGSLGAADPPYWAPMDLFRFTASGQRDFTGGSDGKPTYFSVDGSTVYTGLQFHNSVTTSGSFDGFDLADWDQVGADANANDPFGPGGPSAGDPGTLSATDITMLEALGWKPASQAPVNPTITAQNFSVSPKQAIALANELSVPNPSGDSLTKYWVTDLGHGSGHLTVEGVSEADGRWVQAASNWSNVQYVGGSAVGTDQLEVAVYDATTGSLVYSPSFSATTTGVNGASTAQNFSAWTEPTNTVFDYSADSGQYIADLAASMMKAGGSAASGSLAASLSDQTHSLHSDLLYHADDCGGRERMLNYSLPGSPTAQDASALRWQNVATPLLASSDGHAEMLGPDPHSAVFVASSRTY